MAGVASEAFDDSTTSVAQPAEEEPAPAAEEEKKDAAEAPDARQDLALVETAFGRSGFDDSTWWYVAIFDNPNPDYVFSFAGIDVEALDAGGTILDPSSDYQTILSGRTAVVRTFFSVGQGEIASLGVRGPEAAAATRAPKSTTGAFEITGVTPISSE